MTLSRTQSGFSLIEIVIAVTIMGLVAALIIPNIMGYLRRAKVTSTHIVLKNVTEAIEMYHNDTGLYPAVLNDLTIRPVDEKTAGRWQGPYLKGGEYPTDGWKHDLVYVLNPKGTQPPYELYSWGEHGEGSPSEEWIHARDL